MQKEKGFISFSTPFSILLSSSLTILMYLLYTPAARSSTSLRKSSPCGYTLLELLIVLVVSSIISGFIISDFMKFKYIKREENLETMASNLEVASSLNYIKSLHQPLKAKSVSNCQDVADLLPMKFSMKKFKIDDEPITKGSHKVCTITYRDDTKRKLVAHFIGEAVS